MFNKILISAVVATILTFASYFIGLHFGWITDLNWLEIFSVWTSYSCTYLCVVQSRSNYPIGAISVAALGVLFWQQGLYASAALQVYLFPIMLYGWIRWGKDDDTRPVTHLGLDRWTLGYAVITILAYVIGYETNSWLGGSVAALDTMLLVGSILGQFLLDNKKMENWWVWLAVDVVSVYVYWNQDLKVVAIQMGLFILNAVWGLFEWNKTINKKV
jgi:nicotinamide mononucleotide transporter